MACTPVPVRGASLDDPFFGSLRALASAMGVPAAWLLLIFWIESGLDPRAVNSLCYAGLNQMSGSYLVNTAKVDPNDYATWAASAQLEKVIGPWYRAQAGDALRGKPAPNAGALYAVNFLPGRVKDRGTDMETVLTQEGDRDYVDKAGNWHAYIEANRGLDANKDGKITIRDLNVVLAGHALDTGFVAQLLRLGLDGLPGPSPSPSPEPPPPGGTKATKSKAGAIAGGLLLAALGAGGAVLASRSSRT